WTMHTECLVEGRVDEISLDVTVRFLHLLVRTVVRSNAGKDESVEENSSEWSLASRLADEPLQEGQEREVSVLNLSLHDLLAHPRRVPIEFPAARMVESPMDASATEIILEQQAISGAFILTAEQIDTYRTSDMGIFKLS